jgi:hypothetical protein
MIQTSDLASSDENSHSQKNRAHHHLPPEPCFGFSHQLRQTLKISFDARLLIDLCRGFPQDWNKQPGIADNPNACTR